LVLLANKRLPPYFSPLLIGIQYTLGGKMFVEEDVVDSKGKGAS